MSSRQNENSAAEMMLCITLLSGFLLMDDLHLIYERTFIMVVEPEIPTDVNKSIPLH